MAASQNGFITYMVSIHKKTNIIQKMPKNISFVLLFIIGATQRGLNTILSNHMDRQACTNDHRARIFKPFIETRNRFPGLWNSFPGIDSCAGIFEQSMMGRRNRLGIGLPFRPPWLHRPAESIPSLKV